MIFRQAVWLAISLILSCTAYAETTVLKADRWLDVISGKISSPATIVVADGKIVSIDPIDLPTGAEVVELGDMTLLPGLMDLHTHLAFEDVAGWQYEPATKNTGFYAMRGVRNAKKTLDAGFTTIREVGAPDFVDVELGKAINLGWIAGSLDQGLFRLVMPLVSQVGIVTSLDLKPVLWRWTTVPVWLMASTT